MPPKKGKKKGKKGKKSGNKKKKGDKIQLTPKEQILEYQIEKKDELLSRLNFEFEQIKQDNDKVKVRLQQYKLDREKFAENMVRQYREFNEKRRQNEAETNFDKSDVISAMKANWKIDKIENEDIIKAKSEITGKESKIKMLEDELKQLEFLRDEEIKSNDAQIREQNHFIEDMKENFNALCSYTQKNYEAKWNDVVSHQQRSIETLEKQAQLKAAKRINDDAKHELSDNQWLRNKASIHREYLDAMKAEVEQLQSVNINLHKQLFELNQTNPSFQSFYLTEIDPNDILFQNGILEYDIEDLFDTLSPRLSSHTQQTSKPSDNTDNLGDLDQYQSFKDYLNFNSINFGDLSLEGHSLTIKTPPPKTEAEIMAETHTLPFNSHFSLVPKNTY